MLGPQRDLVFMSTVPRVTRPNRSRDIGRQKGKARPFLLLNGNWQEHHLSPMDGTSDGTRRLCTLTYCVVSREASIMLCVNTMDTHYDQRRRQLRAGLLELEFGRTIVI